MVLTVALEASGVEVRFGRLVAVLEVNFSAPAGSMTALLGPNGAGKSTLIKVLAGLIRPTAGKVTVLGTSPAGARGRIAYVPQREDVYWHYPLTVWDIAAMGKIRAVGQLKRVPKDDEQVWRALEMVGMAKLADRSLFELSGGQQQRAFLARAIAQEGDLFLLDEPIAGLDAEAEASLFDVLFSLKRLGKTIVMSTHDISSTLQAFDYLMILKGKPVAYGSPQQVLTAPNLAMAYGSSRVSMHLEDIKGAAKWG